MSSSSLPLPTICICKNEGWGVMSSDSDIKNFSIPENRRLVCVSVMHLLLYVTIPTRDLGNRDTHKAKTKETAAHRIPLYPLT